MTYSILSKWEKYSRYVKLEKYHKLYCGKCGKLLDECNCNVKYFPKAERKNHIQDRAYYIMAENNNNLWVFRVYMILTSQQIGKVCEYSQHEVMRYSFNENGKLKIFERLDTASVFYSWDWKLGSELKKRKITDRYDFRFFNIEFKSKPIWAKYISIEMIRRLQKNIDRLYLTSLMKILMSNEVKLETMYECKRYDLFEYCFKHQEDINECMVLLKHKKEIPDEILWHDYVDGLKTLGKDVKNIDVLCPKDFTKANKTVEKQCKDRKEKYELSNEVKLYDEEYIKRVSRLIGKDFGNNDFSIKVLPNVEAFYNEGKSMCHCVYRMGYYKKKESYIFSITKDNKRVETAEINNHEVNQCYGYGDVETTHHRKILSLLKRQIPNIYKTLGGV